MFKRNAWFTGITNVFLLIPVGQSLKTAITVRIVDLVVDWTMASTRYRGTSLLQRLRILFLAVVLGLAGCNLFDNDNNDNNEPPLETGLQTISSGGAEREYFLQLPSDSDDGNSIQASALGDDTRKPLLFAYHRYTGSYQYWVGANRPSDLVDVVGDEAIFIAPKGLEDAADKRTWGGQADVDFFFDILAEFDRRGLQYNPNRIFVAGHSIGSEFTHQLGCNHGDVIRAIVIVAGGLLKNDCVGSAAVMMFHGSNDPLTSDNSAAASRQYWVLYNGWDVDAFVPAYEGLCDDYSFPDQPDNVPYPVLWCEHDQGHQWPSFASETAWDLLRGLPEMEPTPAAPPGGGAERATPPVDANLTFQINVPAEINRPLTSEIFLRPLSFIDNPTCSAPDIVLGAASVEDLLIAGEVSEPITVPITYALSGVPEFPSDDWALIITIYVEGGGGTSGISIPGVDYDLAVPVSLVAENTDIVMSDVLDITPVVNVCPF